MVTNLQNELMKLKNKYRLSVLSANRDKENYLSILSQNTRNATSENSNLYNLLEKTSKERDLLKKKVKCYFNFIFQ